MIRKKYLLKIVQSKQIVIKSIKEKGTKNSAFLYN